MMRAYKRSSENNPKNNRNNAIFRAIILALLETCAFITIPSLSQAQPVNTAAVSSADVVGSKSEAFDCPVGSNIIIVACGTDDAADTITNITYNGVGLTELLRNAHSGGVSTSSNLWYLANPATGSNTVAVTASDTVDDYLCAYLCYSGANTTTPFTNTSENEDGTSPFDLDVTCPAGNLALDIRTTAEVETLVADGSQTSRASITGTANSMGVSEEAGAGTTTMTWTATNSASTGIATCLMGQTTTPRAPILIQ